MIDSNYDADRHVTSCLYFASEHGVRLTQLIMPAFAEDNVMNSLMFHSNPKTWDIDKDKRLFIHGVRIRFDKRLTKAACLMVFRT